jgi:hypothetical protein
MTSGSVAKDSWSAFSPDVAKVYLDGYGSPSEASKLLMGSVLGELFGKNTFRLADFGCGNGHLYGFFRGQGLNLHYTGYDFSTSLLDAARERYAGDPNAIFVEDDIQNPDFVAPPADIVLFSHVIEMLESPERALAASSKMAPRAMIRFFEPPADRYDTVELRRLDVGQGTPTVPYLRRSMSNDYYNLLLTKLGCVSVDIHTVEGDKDQIHILKF